MESISLVALSEELLGQARRAGRGRSALSIHQARDQVLRQTLLALAAGQELAEHDSPGEAILQVLQGRVRLTAGDQTWEGTSGDQVTIPPARHSMTALDDAAVLLTVAPARPRSANGQVGRQPRGTEPSPLSPPSRRGPGATGEELQQ